MKVFISYRRSDTQDLCGRLADRLKRVKEVTEVFIDVDGIRPGENFETKIQTAIAQSNACVILIGPSWMGEERGGMRRLFEPGDYVRMEAREALTRLDRVIPALANGAPMPTRDELPDDLRELARLNAVPVRHADFEHDMERLVGAILERRSRPGRLWAFLMGPLPGRIIRVLVGVLLALIVLMALAVGNYMLWERSLTATLNSRELVIGIIVVVVAAGAILGALSKPKRRR